MSSIPSSETYIKKEVLSKSWNYLNDNFHKFSDTNKIKISLELCKKDLPTQITGEVMKQIISITSSKPEGLLNRLESKPETVSGEISVQ
jgi:hypothetical protein